MSDVIIAGLIIGCAITLTTGVWLGWVTRALLAELQLARQTHHHLRAHHAKHDQHDSGLSCQP